jgi:uncharacterized protein (TIGR00369 family)
MADHPDPEHDGDFALKRHLGMTIDAGDPGDGRGIARLELDERHHNPNGVAHGAVLFAMVDTAMGKATMEVLPEGRRCASIEVQLRFLRPEISGALEAEAHVVKQGRRIVFLDGRVNDEDGRLVATASGTFAVLEP